MLPLLGILWVVAEPGEPVWEAAWEAGSDAAGRAGTEAGMAPDMAEAGMKEELGCVLPAPCGEEAATTSYNSGSSLHIIQAVLQSMAEMNQLQKKDKT